MPIGALGTLTASVTTDTTNSGSGGVITWNYSVSAASVEYLQANETKVETFNITLNDGNGGTVDRLLTVTITGTNDAPVFGGVGVGSGSLVFGGYGSPGVVIGALVDTNGDGIEDEAVDIISLGSAVGTGFIAHGVDVADIDGDGDVDIAVANTSGPLQVFYGQGDTDADGLPNYVRQDLAGTSQLGINVADLDGDGDDDMFLSRWNDQPEQVYINTGDSDGDGIVSIVVGTIAGTAGYTLESALVDLDNDNDLDVVTSDLYGNIQVLYNLGDTSGDGIPNFAVDVVDTVGSSNYGIAIGGKGMDILIGGLGKDDIKGGGSSVGGDLFVGGWTVHDNDVAKLRAIRDIWTSGNTQANIVSQLTNAGGLLNTSSVFGDGQVDKLEGHKNSVDLYFAELGIDSLKGNDSKDTVVSV